MTRGAPESEPSVARALAELFGSLLLVTVLACVCVLSPIGVASRVNPWAGVLVALGSFYVWGRFGPRPFPGCLPGVLCLWGFAAILGSLLVCVALAVR